MRCNKATLKSERLQTIIDFLIKGLKSLVAYAKETIDKIYCFISLFKYFASKACDSNRLSWNQGMIIVLKKPNYLNISMVIINNIITY